MDSLLSLVPSSGQGDNGVKTDMKSHSNCLKISRICFAYLTTIAGQLISKANFEVFI